MANFNIDYTNDSDYTYDSDKIEIDSGIAKLKSQATTNATFGANFSLSIDASWGEGVLTGTQTGGVVVTNGKLDLTGGTAKYIDYQADLNADSQQTGCIRFKYTPNYSGAPSYYQMMICILKTHGDSSNGIMLYHSINDAIGLIIRDKDDNSLVASYLQSWTPVAGTEYEFEINYDITNGNTMVFLDGAKIGNTYTTTGVRDENIGLVRIGSATDGVAPWLSDFSIDDIIIFPTVQHTSNYTKGYTVNNLYSNDSPTIYKTNGDGIANIHEYISFTETLGASNSGYMRYQISGNGTDWYYWDGSVWSIAGISDYTSASDCDSYIMNFIDTTDKIYIKAFLISDGSQATELDANQVGYVINTAPFVYGGTDKNAIYNVSTTPFSDCLFSDAEDNILKAEYKEEGGSYIEIPQGAYSSLLDAVKAFSYTPTHSGNKTLYLKITDTYSISSEDTMVINVNQVNVTINIKDSNGNHLSNVTFDAGDSSADSTQNSPFTFTYDIGTFTSTVSKTFFDSVTQENTISISTTSIDYTMEKETSIDDLIMSVDYPNEFVLGDTFNLDCKVNINLTGYKIRCSIKDVSGNLVSLGTANTGGSDSEINIYNPASGNFMIICAKDLTDDFDNDIYITIELENTSSQVRTMIDKKVYFSKDRLTWTDASES